MGMCPSRSTNALVHRNLNEKTRDEFLGFILRNAQWTRAAVRHGFSKGLTINGLSYPQIMNPSIKVWETLQRVTGIPVRKLLRTPVSLAINDKEKMAPWKIILAQHPTRERVHDLLEADVCTVKELVEFAMKSVKQKPKLTCYQCNFAATLADICLSHHNAKPIFDEYALDKCHALAVEAIRTRNVSAFRTIVTSSFRLPQFSNSNIPRFSHVLVDNLDSEKPEHIEAMFYLVVHKDNNFCHYHKQGLVQFMVDRIPCKKDGSFLPFARMFRYAAKRTTNIQPTMALFRALAYDQYDPRELASIISNIDGDNAVHYAWLLEAGLMEGNVGIVKNTIDKVDRKSLMMYYTFALLTYNKFIIAMFRDKLGNIVLHRPMGEGRILPLSILLSKWDDSSHSEKISWEEVMEFFFSPFMATHIDGRQRSLWHYAAHSPHAFQRLLQRFHPPHAELRNIMHQCDNEGNTVYFLLYKHLPSVKGRYCITFTMAGDACEEETSAVEFLLRFGANIQKTNDAGESLMSLMYDRNDVEGIRIGMNPGDAPPLLPQ